MEGERTIQIRNGDLLGPQDVARELNLSSERVKAYDHILRPLRTRGGYRVYLRERVEEFAAARRRATKAKQEDDPGPP